jgi:hypothetical protein
MIEVCKEKPGGIKAPDGVHSCAHGPNHRASRPRKPGLDCPVKSCKELIAPTMMVGHLERHAQGIFLGEVPQAWLYQNRKFVCMCQQIVSETSRNAHKNRCHAVQPSSLSIPTFDDDAPMPLPSLEEIMSLSRPTLKHIPFKARQIWGRVLQDAIHQATTNNSLESFTHLAMLAKCVLPSAKRAGRKHTHRKSITDLCKQWVAGKRLELWEEAVKNSRKPTTSKAKIKNTKEETAKHNQMAAIAFAEEGLYGKACRVLSSKGLAPYSEETRLLLEEKHPKQAVPTIPEVEVPSLQLPTNFNIRETLRSFPNGTACGPSGLRVEHLLEACEASLPVAFHTTLRHFINHLIAGKAPPTIAPLFAGAALTALKKSKPGAPLDIRPIAVGEVFRRLVGKCLCKLTATKAKELFAPHQFGVACPGGVEKVVHKMRAILGDHWEDEDFVILKVDMKNAFNMVSRQAVMDECGRCLPEVLPWVAWCYKSHPKLWHPLGQFVSAAGVQQGDPIGPLLFSLALNRLVDSLNDVENLTHNFWYLDDGILAGSQRAIHEGLARIQSAEAWLGLQLNIGKCELFSRQDLSHFPETMKKSAKPNLEVLGAPIGDDDFCAEYVQDKCIEAENLLKKISEIHDPQVSVALLRICGGFCRLSHIARCCPSEQVSEPLAAHDRAVMKCLEDSAAIELSDRARLQAQLGLKAGGLGLRSLQQHSPAAYIASINSVGMLPPQLETTVKFYNNRISPSQPIHVSETNFSQKSLSAAIDKRALSELIDSAPSMGERARLLAISDPRTADWLLATPSPGLGLRLEPNEVQVLIKLRLGLPLGISGTCCSYCPDRELDMFGHHALTCRRGPDVIHRHNELRDAINALLNRALLNPRLEQGSGLGSQTRPADILVPVWSLGKPAALDVTVVHPLNPKHINGASTDVTHSLIAAEERKHLENDPKCEELGWTCVPMAVTAYGAWGHEAHQFLARVAHRISTRQLTPASQIINATFCNLGIILARCSARAILARQL